MSEEWIIALILAFGLIYGSFASMASYRLPRGERIGGGRSHCTACRHPLGVAALVPLFSWLWQKGKCRYCRSPISWRYPLTEVTQALLFLWVYARFGISLEGAVMALFTLILLIAVVVDLEWQIIPDETQIAMLLLGLAFHIAGGTQVVLVLSSFAIGAAVGLSLYYGYSRLRRVRMLGFGDVKFLMVAGVWLASPMDWVPFLFYAGLLGIVTGIFWQAAGKGERFPFGPALAASLLLQLLSPAGALFFWTVSAVYR